MIDVHTVDGVGVLFRVTAALAEFDLDIRAARVNTMGTSCSTLVLRPRPLGARSSTSRRSTRSRLVVRDALDARAKHSGLGVYARPLRSRTGVPGSLVGGGVSHPLRGHRGARARPPPSSRLLSEYRRGRVADHALGGSCDRDRRRSRRYSWSRTLDWSAYHGHSPAGVGEQRQRRTRARQILTAMRGRGHHGRGPRVLDHDRCPDARFHAVRPADAAQLHPRPGHAGTLGTFVATFVYATLTLGAVADGNRGFVPHLSITVALVFVLRGPRGARVLHPPRGDLDSAAERDRRHRATCRACDRSRVRTARRRRSSGRSLGRSRGGAGCSPPTGAPVVATPERLFAVRGYSRLSTSLAARTQ